MRNDCEYTWRITDIKDETPQVKSLYLEAIDDRPKFIAGQYLTIKLPKLGPIEGKAYSISSAPFEEKLRVSVKKIGAFSSTLLSLTPNNTIRTSPPYGFFYPGPEETTPIIFIAGGIGITPILSIIKDLSHKQDRRPLHLFYSNQTRSSIAFADELATLATQNQNLSIHHFITRETLEDDDHTAGHISSAHIEKLAPEAQAAEYFLCGAMDFTKSFWKLLRESGIKQHQIYTEGFF